MVIVVMVMTICVVKPQKVFAYNFTGQGTSSNPYLISSPEDLRQLATNVNNGNNYHDEYFKMTANITFNANVLLEDGELNPNHSNFEEWIPIGNAETKYFCGNFDGNGYSVSGLYTNNYTEDSFNALFGFFSGKISNLVIYDSYFGNYNAASIVGCVLSKSGYSPKITNCRNYAHVDGYFKGGIVARNMSNSLIVDRCINYGKVTGKNSFYGAGIVGYTKGEVIIKNCVNYGNIQGSTAPCGIVGGMKAGVYNSANFGKVNGNTTEAGICSYCYEINNCVNYGIIDDGNGYALFVTISDGQKMDNTYFFSLSAKKAYSTIQNINNLISWTPQFHYQSMNASQMKDQSFLNQLNLNAQNLGSDFSLWKFGENGYPTLEFVDTNDTHSGIKQVTNKIVEPQVIYSVSGQRLTKLKKGINIINGKKVLVK